MRKRLTSLFIVLCMMITMMPNVIVSAESTFSGGFGTEIEPYLISTADDLRVLAAEVNAAEDYTSVYEGIYFKMTNDIDLSYASDFTPIGDGLRYFGGVFDGDGKTVTLHINSEEATYAALFGGNRGIIKNVIVAGSVISTGHLAGVVGFNNCGIVTNCINKAEICHTGSTETSYAGGVVAYNDGGIIANCINTGSVVSKERVGGICGYNYYSGVVINCYNSGGVSGTDYVGGISGYEAYTNIKNSLNNGYVYASDGTYVGGIAGYAQYDDRIEHCYYNSTLNIGMYAIGNQETKGFDVDGDIILDHDIITKLNLYISSADAIDGVDFMYWEAYEGVVSFTVAEPILPYAITNNSQDLLDVSTYAFPGEAVTVTAKESSYAFVTEVIVTNANGERVDVTVSIDNIFMFTMPDGDVSISANAELKFEEQDGAYNLYSADDMKALAAAHVGGYDSTGKSFRLVNDVSLSTDEGFVPIGTDDVPFRGTFDGNSKTVTLNLSSTEFYTGLFGKNEGIVKNINTVGSVSGTYYVAGIASQSKNGKVMNCTNSAAITGTNTIGGIIGGYGDAINCYNSGTVTATCDEVGGIIGCASLSEIKNCANSAEVTGTEKVGAIAGIENTNTDNFLGNYYVSGTADFGIGTVVSTASTADDDTKTKAVTQEVLFSEDGLTPLNAYAVADLVYDTVLLYWALEDGKIVLSTNTEVALPYAITNNSKYLTVPETAKSGTDVEITVGTIPSHLKLISITVDGTAIEANTDGKYIFQMPEKAVTVDMVTEILFKKDEASGEYILDSVEKMIMFSDAVNAGFTTEGETFRLTTDVSLSTEGGFNPIGTSTKPFKGTFDGGGNTVTLNLSAGTYTGLFGRSAGIVKNVNTAGSVNGIHRVGAVVGDGGNGRVINCTNSATVTASSLSAAGIVGCYGDVINCYNSGNVTTPSGQAGGIIGVAYKSIIRNCVNSATVTADGSFGSVVGFISGSENEISGNFYVTGTADLGIGSNQGTELTEDDETKTKAIDKEVLFTEDGLLDVNRYADSNTLDGVALLYWITDGNKIELTSVRPVFPYAIANNSEYLTAPEFEKPGETVTVTVALPEDHEMIASVSGITVAVADETVPPVEATASGENTYTFTMPECNVTISAVYKYKEPEKDENGTYIIADETDFQLFAMMVNDGKTDVDAKVTAVELNMSEYAVMLGEKSPYEGTFDGNDATIITNGPLFYATDGATLKNINAESISVDDGYAAGLVKYADNTYIDNCNVAAYMENCGEAGGVVYEADGSTITNCTVTAEGIVEYFGGIAFSTVDSIIANCMLCESNVEVSLYYGGIVSYAKDGTEIYNCANVDALEVYDEAGGIVEGTHGDVIMENNFYISDRLNGINGFYDVNYDYAANRYVYGMTDKNSAVTYDEYIGLYMPAMLNDYIEANPDIVSGVTLNKWSVYYIDESAFPYLCFADEEHKEIYSITYAGITPEGAPYGAMADDEISWSVHESAVISVIDENSESITATTSGFTMPESDVTVSIIMDSGISETKEIDGKTYVVVKTAEDFMKAITSIANGNDILNVYIANDITLSAADTENYPENETYKGIFDGAGHKVTFEDLNMPEAALLTRVSEEGVIKNLTLDGSITSEGTGVASFAVANYGTIINCINEADITGEYAGGVVYGNEGNIINCINRGSVTGTQAGAICCGNYGNAEMCLNTGTITSSETGNDNLIFEEEGNGKNLVDTTTVEISHESVAASMNYTIESFKFMTKTRGEGVFADAGIDAWVFEEVKLWSVNSEKTEVIFADENNKPYYMITSKSNGFYQAGATATISFDVSDVQEGFEIYGVAVTDIKGNEIEVTEVKDQEYTYTFTMPDSSCTAIMLVAPTLLEKETGEDGRTYYLIETLDDLLAFKAAVDLGNTKINAKLTADITDEYTSTPIGESVYAYDGIFDGNGYSINLNMTDADSSYQYFGLFGKLGINAVVKDLTLKGTVSSVIVSGYVGAVTGYNSGTIVGCTNEAAITGEHYVSGIVGLNEAVPYISPLFEMLSAEEISGTGIIKACVNKAGLKGYYVGGITGRSENYWYNNLKSDNAATITDCENNGNLIGEYSGGIAATAYGYTANDRVVIEDCVNTGYIEGESEAAGIVRRAADTVINNCVNNGNVDGYGSVAGGMIGDSNGGNVVKNCENNGDIYAEFGDVGGIVGDAEYGVEVINCINNGDIKAFEGYASGIVGSGYNSMKIKNCYSSGIISAEEAYAIARHGSYTDNISALSLFADEEAEDESDILIKNTYYLQTDDVNSDVESSNFEEDDFSEAVTDEVVSSGEVSYKLNKGINDDTLNKWSVANDMVIFADEDNGAVYAVSVDAEIEHGTVAVDIENKYIKAGTSVTVTVTPDEGYELKEITGVELDENNSFVMPEEDVTISAEFSAIEPDPTPTPTPDITDPTPTPTPDVTDPTPTPTPDVTDPTPTPTPGQTPIPSGSRIYQDGVTEDGKAIVKYEAAESLECIAVYAKYDENGVLISVQIITDGSDIIAEPNSKIMLWNSIKDMQPLCDAYVVE